MKNSKGLKKILAIALSVMLVAGTATGCGSSNENNSSNNNVASGNNANNENKDNDSEDNKDNSDESNKNNESNTEENDKNTSENDKENNSTNENNSEDDSNNSSSDNSSNNSSDDKDSEENTSGNNGSNNNSNNGGSNNSGSNNTGSNNGSNNTGSNNGGSNNNGSSNNNGGSNNNGNNNGNDSSEDKEPSDPDVTPEPSKLSASDITSILVNHHLGDFMLGDATSDDLTNRYYMSSDLVNSYSVKLPMMMVQASEVAVFQVKDGNAQAVKDGIAKRLADLETTWSQYLPSEYDKVKNYKLVEEGEYILFAVAEDSDAVVSTFRKILSGEITKETPVSNTDDTSTQSSLNVAEMASSLNTDFYGSNLANMDDALNTLYGLNSGDLEEFSLNAPMLNITSDEFAIFKVKDSSKINTVKAGIEKRVADLDANWSTYLPAQHEKVKNHIVVVEGDYVLFAIADDTAAVKSAFLDMVK